MSNIVDINEAWHNHSGLEVETFIKSRITAALAASGGKIGHVELVGSNIIFYDEEGGTAIATIPLGGDVYNISVGIDLGTVFYILADEPTKTMTINASTTVSSFGSSESENFPEAYSYIVAVNTGGGYVNRISGTFNSGESSSFDIRPYIATGDNYIRIAVTGLTSGHTKTIVCTATLTTLTMSVSHAWQNIWQQNSSYTITGIRFAGSLVKTLHVAVDGVEVEPVVYTSGQSYTTSATTYTIPATAFPNINSNSVHDITLWMTAQGVSTKVQTFRIMCIVDEDETPLVAINAITPAAMNFTSSTLFSYAVYNADKVSISMSASIGGNTYQVTNGTEITERSEGNQYSFTYPLEIDTGVIEATSGTLTISIQPFNKTVAGITNTATTVLDNTYSYVATPGALFYMNAAARDNGSVDKLSFVNEMGSSQDGNFEASYSLNPSGMSWYNDGWTTDDNGIKSFCVNAGSSVEVVDFAPLGLLPSYQNGLTVEMMIKTAYPSNYDAPVFSMVSGDNVQNGLFIYPTKIVVYGTSERSDVLQSVNLSENRMTHLTITFNKNYEGVSSRNLVSIYVNGICNANFAYSGSSSFGTGNFVIGQSDTDAYLYKMRVYGTALDSQAVFNNFLNCIVDGLEFNRREVDDKNNVLEAGVISYEAVKAAGLNTMIVEMDTNSHDIPSFDNQASYSGCKMKFEYSDHPEWNVEISGLDIDGQGTTSKKYFRWNLRGKTTSSSVWTYGDGTTETGKEGYFAGHDYARVDRITAKKNYASSMQGHKIGLTGLYNDLFAEIGLNENLPNPNYRVAVYQFPFIGFKHNTANDTYEFIGLYTAGPDKSSKVTFGYSSSYSNLLSLEGPNHAPRGTRFLHPWVDVAYSSTDETLTYGGEEGWDCDYVGNGLSSDKASDAANILSLYESEWKPAYNLVFNCSPYIVSASEMISALNNASITTIAHLTNPTNSATILEGSTNGYSNQLLSFYDTSYELYFYRTLTGAFTKLSDVDSNSEHNVVTTLRSEGFLSTTNPTTAQIRTARAARFKSKLSNYFDVDQTIFHYAYCELFGVKDNFAKNSYPQKFLPISGSTAACRWGWRQDDLDSVFMTDNNGQETAKYSIEPGDTALGTEIFQGGNSALWVLIRDNYTTEIRNMMLSIANAAASIATRLGIQGDGLHNSLFNVTSYYCWERSSKYFSAMLYEADRRWSYIEPWLRGSTKVYNNVPPLSQALGDQYQAERLWMERRIAYIFSKYRIGAFTGDTTGYNTLAFTLAQPFTFSITPAIDLYPVVTLANTADVQGPRTTAGTISNITITADGQTTNYIKGSDWLASLGDLSGMTLTSRGAGEDIAFSVNGIRLQNLKIGDSTASKVKFNATTFTVASPSITSIDARNTSTISNEVSLLNCPRLRTALFGGSGATGLLLPVGAKVTQVQFPASAATVFMHSLPFLTDSNLTLPTLSNITSLCIVNCPNINPISKFLDIASDSNSQLQYLTIAWDEPVTVTPTQLTTLATIGENLLGNILYENGNIIIVNGDPIANGQVQVTQEIPMSIFANVRDKYKGIELINSDNLAYIDFADNNVKTIALANWDLNSDNKITLDEAKSVTNIGNIFKGNTNIVSFDELQYFTEIDNIPGGTNTSTTGAFNGCTSLESVTLPSSVKTINGCAFYQCSSLSTVSGCENVNTLGVNAFSGTGVTSFNFPNLTSLGVPTHYQCASLSRIEDMGYITSISDSTYGQFQNCTSLTYVKLPDTLTTIESNAFRGCPALETIEGGNNVTSIGTSAFLGSGPIVIDFPNLTTISTAAFSSCTAQEVRNLGHIETLGLSGASAPNGVFTQSANLRKVVLPATLKNINANSFYRCYALTDLTFGGNEEKIENNAFEGCPFVGTINLPKLKSIGSAAFTGCTGITAIKSLGSINTLTGGGSTWGGAFNSCTSLKTVVLPNTLFTIGSNSFYGCSALESVTGCSNLSRIEVQAFNRDSNLEYLELPSSVLFIGNSAFAGCSKLSVNGNGIINLPNLTQIGTNSFSDMLNVSVENLGIITSVPQQAFSNNKSLRTVVFPDTVTFFGANVFTGCNNPGIDSVTIQATTPPSVVVSIKSGGIIKRIFVPGSSIVQYATATGWTGHSDIEPIGADNVNYVISGVWLSGTNNPALTLQSDYCVTPMIALRNVGHPITWSGGAIIYDGTDGNGHLRFYNANHDKLGYYNTTMNERTINPTDVGTSAAYIRFTVKTSELANAYVYDEIDHVYLWKGSDVTVQY